MRGRPDRVLRMIAFAMGGLVLLMAAMELGKAVREDMDRTAIPSTDDPLRAELARCRVLTPEDLATDTDWQAAWAENRGRFFGAPSDAPEELPMGGVGVIDRFLEVFASYIDSGFGLLGGDVAFLATTLIVIDVTLAALFWAWGADDDIIARLVTKTLFVGVFAYIISNWNALARIVFESFAGLGLVATGGTLGAGELLQPGRIAEVGLETGRPILASIADLMGFVSFFENFIQIAILMFAWIVVILSFFILAIQLFVTLIEFKLATLAGFVLVPFGLFNKTAFMAERVLGLVISSGVKVLVLAVIVGIGSTIFGEFTAGFAGEPTIEDAMAVVLAALSLLALGIFGPGIAFTATGGSFSNSPATNLVPANNGPPAWAQRLKRQQSLHHGVATAAHVIRSGDQGGGGTSVSLSEKP